MRLEGSVNESKTIAFNFTHHGQLRDGETISNPIVISEGDTLTFGSPVVITVPFSDSNGKRIAIGKGVKVRVQADMATPGVEYKVLCRVSTSGGDVIEQEHTYFVKPSLP